MEFDTYRQTIASALDKVSVSIRTFVSNNGLPYTIFLAVSALAFITVKFAVPTVFSGSYLDEYWHLVSGITLFEEGYLPRFYYYQKEYDRGSFVTWTAGIYLWLFGKTIFVAKLVPLSIGVLNFFLAAYLSHKAIRQKKYRILFLLIYTVSPWTIFNHFYLRMYVFYELFLLVNLFLSERLLTTVNRDKKRGALVLLVLLIGFNTFYFLFGHDQGIYMPLLGVLVAVGYIFAFETTNLRFPNPGFLGRALTVVFRLKPVWKVVALVAMATASFYVLKAGDKIDYLLHADLYWTSGRDLKYDNFFLDKNLPFTVFFCLSVISVVFLRTSFQRLLVLVAGLLFVLHYTSSPDLQIVRGLLYFLPIFYLVAVISLAELRYLNSWVLFGLFGAVLLYTTVGNFSKTYFKGPNVPSEVHYIDYARAYDAIKEHCSDKILVEATPSSFVATFYDVKVDYVISSTGWIKRDNMFYFDKETNMFRTAYNDIPVLNRFSQLEELGGDVCLLVRYPSQRRFVEKRVLLSLKKTARPLEFEHLTLFRL